MPSVFGPIPLLTPRVPTVAPVPVRPARWWLLQPMPVLPGVVRVRPAVWAWLVVAQATRRGPTTFASTSLRVGPDPLRSGVL